MSTQWRKGGEKGGEGEGEEKDFRVVFWNVVGLRNGEFWNGLRDWDMITLTETWIEKKEWSRIKDRLSGDMCRIYNKQEGGIGREGHWKE